MSLFLPSSVSYFLTRITQSTIPSSMKIAAKVFVLSYCVLSIFSCCKEEPIDLTIPFTFTFQPTLQEAPFLFNQHYLLNDKVFKLTEMEFVIYSAEEKPYKIIQLNENVSAKGILTEVRIEANQLDDFLLKFYSKKRECENTNFDYPTCTYNDFGYFKLHGQIDLTNDGILETEFNFSVNTTGLELEKPISNLSKDFPLIRFQLDIKRLFGGIDETLLASELVQKQMTLNLASALVIQ